MSQTKAQLIDPVDGTIVNADINASAAIAGSKISPDFGSQAISTTGTGSSLGRLRISNVNPFIELVDTNNNSDFSIRGASGNFIIRDDTNAASRLSIDSSGLVGIGTSSPASLLHIESSSAPTLRIDDSDTSGAFLLQQDGANGSALLSSAGTFSIGVSNDNSAATITFLTRNSERFRVDSSGRVLIGTTNNTPAANDTAGIVFGDNTAGVAKTGVASFCCDGAAPLLLTRLTSDGNILGIADDAGTKGRLRVVSNDFEINATEDLRISTGTGNTERIRLTNSGNLGIGTTPNERLVVSGNAGVTGALFITGNTSTPSAGAFLYRPANNTLAFGSNSAERVRITSGGFLYVNKTSSSDFGRFEVKGGTADDIETSDIRTETVATFSGSSPGTTASGKGVGIVIKPIADRGCNFFIGAANSSSNQEAHGSLIFRSGNFASATAERLRIDQNGHLLPGVDNSLNLGSASKRWANLYTTDLKLSNEGSQNDVDSTWGNYTIQEGHEDLFLINHRTGKKFKFNLTEVA